MSHQQKTLRDPVHGSLVVPDPLIAALIDTYEFQRLRRIRQLGSCHLVFHGAEHSRFQHAIGTMWLMHQVLQRWRAKELLEVDPHTRRAALAAALLHDIGHGPFSHALEQTFVGLDHEKLGQALIAGPLAKVLESFDCCPTTVCEMLTNRYREPVFSELLSGQLDVDRMDYLQRDSLYTGVKYGLFDCERILDTLVPLSTLLAEDDLFTEAREGYVLAVDPKGVLAVEEFLFSRYFMYWQVYLHRAVRSAELLLKLVLERARELFLQSPEALWLSPSLRDIFGYGTERASEIERGAPLDPTPPELLEVFLDLDDFDLFHALKNWRKAADPILQDLSARLLERRLFKGALLAERPDRALELKRRAQKRYGEHWTYYLRSDPLSSSSYAIYRPGTDRPIRTAIPHTGGWQEISQATHSTAILGLSQRANTSGGFLYFAPELLEE